MQKFYKKIRFVVFDNLYFIKFSNLFDNMGFIKFKLFFYIFFVIDESVGFLRKNFFVFQVRIFILNRVNYLFLLFGENKLKYLKCVKQKIFMFYFIFMKQNEK